MKKGRKVRTKRRRFFVLKFGVLEYYEDESRSAAKGSIPLWPRTMVSFVHKGPDAAKGKLRIKHPEIPEERDLYASSQREAERWVQALESAAEAARRGGAKEGSLMKRGGWSGTEYQPRWCVFDGDAVFSSYHAASDDAPTVRLDLRTCATTAEARALVRAPSGAPGACFELSGFSHPFVFACETTGNRNAWVESLQRALARHRQEGGDAVGTLVAAGTKNPLSAADADVPPPRATPVAEGAPPGAPPTMDGLLERRQKHQPLPGARPTHATEAIRNLLPPQVL